MALSLNSNITDEVLGKQFKAFIEGIFSYSQSSVLQGSQSRSRSDSNGSVIENVFDTIEKQIKDSYTKSLNNIKTASQKELENKKLELKKLQDELSNTIIEPSQQRKGQILKEQAILQKEIDQLKLESEKELQAEKLKLAEELNQKLYQNERKRELASKKYKENLWKNASIQDRVNIIRQNKDRIELEIDKLDQLKQINSQWTEEEEKEYKKLIEEKIQWDRKYEILQKSLIKFEPKESRYQKYKLEIEKIKKEASIQKEVNKQENQSNPEVRKTKNKEIQDQMKSQIKTAQSIYGITKSEDAVEKTTSIVESVASAISGGPSGINSMLEQMLGKASPVVSAILSVLKIVGSINQLVGQGIQKALTSQTTYMGQMNARLQASSQDETNYYNKMIDWSSEASDGLGVAIGEWNSYVNKTKYVEKLNELVQYGIAYNAEERALISTLSDKMVTTFDALDQNLTRLIRIQQRDVTYAAMGSEALLTQFLNRQFQDTSYLNNMYDAVQGILLDATAKMSADQASAFSYEVQKWLGSLYSVGLSEQGVQQLAQGVTYLATGNVSQLTQNQQLQYIYAAAAERSGMSLADILTSGLDQQTTNELLENVVSLLSDIYNSTSLNTVQAAWSDITGMSIADLRSIQNVNQSLASITESHASWTDSLRETENQLDKLETSIGLRISQSEQIENIINNALFSMGNAVLEDTFGSGPFNIWRSLGLEGESKYIGYYLGNQLGGTFGNIISTLSITPAILDNLSTNFSDIMNDSRVIGRNEEGNIYEQESGRVEHKQISLLDRFSTNYLSSAIFESVAKDLETSLESTSISMMDGRIRNQAGLLPSISDYEDIFDYLDTNTKQLFQASLNIQQNQDAITNETFSNFVAAAESFNESFTPSMQTDLPNLVQQAENAVNSAQTVINESSEDKALLEEAADVQDYLFENEQTIRVTLALIEDAASKTLLDSLNLQSQQEDLKQIKSTLQDKVKVDLADSDVNILLNSIDRQKWSI